MDTSWLLVVLISLLSLKECFGIRCYICSYPDNKRCGDQFLMTNQDAVECAGGTCTKKRGYKDIAVTCGSDNTTVPEVWVPAIVGTDINLLTAVCKTLTLGAACKACPAAAPTVANFIPGGGIVCASNLTLRANLFCVSDVYKADRGKKLMSLLGHNDTCTVMSWQQFKFNESYIEIFTWNLISRNDITVPEVGVLGCVMFMTPAVPPAC
ncbi:hypothetical protein KUTeg_024536, partial [Tegillarca granosa]